MQAGEELNGNLFSSKSSIHILTIPEKRIHQAIVSFRIDAFNKYFVEAIKGIAGIGNRSALQEMIENLLNDWSVFCCSFFLVYCILYKPFY